jgi:hypothetical protein
MPEAIENIGAGEGNLGSLSGRELVVWIVR